MFNSQAAQRFHQSVLDAYCGAAEQCGLHETRFLSMVDEQGAVRAVKRILGNNQFVYRATELVERGHAEYTVEHLVLRPEFAGLFTAQERLIASNRLHRGRTLRKPRVTPLQ